MGPRRLPAGSGCPIEVTVVRELVSIGVMGVLVLGSDPPLRGNCHRSFCYGPLVGRGETCGLTPPSSLSYHRIRGSSVGRWSRINGRTLGGVRMVEVGVKKLLVYIRLGVCVALLAGVGVANADVSAGFASGDLSALATFSVSGSTLTVTLENTASVDVTAPEDVLTGVFFDISGFGGTLTPQSALLSSVVGTPVLFNSVTTQPGTGHNNFAGVGDIGSEAGYRDGASIEQAGTGDHAIGMVGMDDFMGVTTRFDLDDSHDLQKGASLGGMEYGIVNASYTGGANHPLDGANALVTTSIIYTFGGFAGSESDIGNIAFNYGTEFNPIPAPGAAALAMIGFGAVGWLRRRIS